jgi:tRNA threonylcarbamoyl adenosine modification protein YjeE
MSEIALPDERATGQLAMRLAAALAADAVVALDGPLGAGKTTLVRYLVAALGGDPAQVSSPTFTLMHQYRARLPIVHIDAYRLSAPGDLIALGFDELREGGIAVVEWAQRVDAALSGCELWRIRLDHRLAGGRQATVTTPPGLEGKWLHELSAR